MAVSFSSSLSSMAWTSHAVRSVLRSNTFHNYHRLNSGGSVIKVLVMLLIVSHLVEEPVKWRIVKFHLLILISSSSDSSLGFPEGCLIKDGNIIIDELYPGGPSRYTLDFLMLYAFLPALVLLGVISFKIRDRLVRRWGAMCVKERNILCDNLFVHSVLLSDPRTSKMLSLYSQQQDTTLMVWRSFTFLCVACWVNFVVTVNR